MERFAAELRDLQSAAGRPSLRRLEALLDSPHQHFSRSTVHEKLTGKSMAEEAFVKAFVEACVAHASSKGIALPGHLADVQWWIQRQLHMIQEMDADRRRDRSVTLDAELRQRAEARRPLANQINVRPISEWDPVLLGVHHAIEVDASTTGSRSIALPAYLRRRHDAALGERLAHVDASVLIVVTGTACTGKTRACYEAIRVHLAERDLYVPTDGIGLLEMAEQISASPGPVVWLDELDTFLDGATGPAVATTLLQLMNLSTHPVVMIGSMRSEHWAKLTAEPAYVIGSDHEQGNRSPHPSDNLDVHRQARTVLRRARRISIGDELTADEMRRIPADARWHAAAQGAGERRLVIQTLSGGPLMVDRYENPTDAAGRYARALLTGAMVTRRLGFRSLPTASALRAFAEGYLDPQDRVRLPGRWWDTALRHATAPLYGIRALTPLPEETGQGNRVGYRLADYLDQHGARISLPLAMSHRLWDELCDCTSASDDLGRLAWQAQRFYLYRYATILARRAADAGVTSAMLLLYENLQRIGRDHEADGWLRRAADLGDSYAQYLRAEDARRTGDMASAHELMAAAADAGEPLAIRRLYGQLIDEAPSQALAWLRRGAEAGDVIAMWWLVQNLLERDDHSDVRKWLTRISASNVSGVIKAVEHDLWRRGHDAVAEQWRLEQVRVGDPTMTMLFFERHRQASRVEYAVRKAKELAEEGSPSAMLQHAWYLRSQANAAQDGFGSWRWRRRATREQAHANLHAQSVAWLQRAATAGNQDARYALVQRLWNEDRAEAERWLFRGAEDGGYDFLHWMDEVYEAEGRHDELMTWLRARAAEGDLVAMRHLGSKMYTDEHNPDGLTWMLRAYLGGDIGTTLFLFPKLSAEQRHDLERYGLEPDAQLAGQWQ
ncbi:hypothetical protein AB0C29_00355 [Actinoplanes sp. NPDC048791]|uniref:hypothetical protein n=1 Tax=Actinoplanes sp. NPDC048791 TaxID=3154623 RepID=UPI0033F36B76